MELVDKKAHTKLQIQNTKDKEEQQSNSKESLLFALHFPYGNTTRIV